MVPTLLLRPLDGLDEWVVVMVNRAGVTLLGDRASPGRHLSSALEGSRSLLNRLQEGIRTGEPFEGTLHGLRGSVPVRVRTLRAGVLAVVYLQDCSELAEQAARLERHALESRQQAKMQALGTLAGGIAHEFNNVLAGLVGFAELALERAREEEGNASEIREVLAAAARAKRLVHRILLFARQSEGERTRVDLNVILSDMKEFIRQTLPPHIRIQWLLSAQELPVTVDRDAVEHCFLNLAANARDAMPHGGVMTVETQLDQGMVRWAVEDDGLGMDEETLRRAIEPFFTRKPPGAGTGLGLSSVKSMVCSHGGHMGIQSRPGLGTRVEMRLPSPGLSKPEAQARDPTPTADPPDPLRPARILVVDDEPSICRSVQRILELDGHQVRVAESGARALAACAEEAWDLLLVDLAMPDMDGEQLASKVLARWPHQKIIFSSGQVERLESVHLKLPQSAQFLAKPYVRRELLREVHLALSRPSDANPDLGPDN